MRERRDVSRSGKRGQAEKDITSFSDIGDERSGALCDDL